MASTTTVSLASSGESAALSTATVKRTTSPATSGAPSRSSALLVTFSAGVWTSKASAKPCQMTPSLPQAKVTVCEV